MFCAGGLTWQGLKPKVSCARKYQWGGAGFQVFPQACSTPGDVSVIGFDDIPGAEFQNPPLTAVRQPLEKMGEIAASALLSRITQSAKPSSIIYVDPELIVRETTTHAAAQPQASNQVIARDRVIGNAEDGMRARAALPPDWLRPGAVGR
jgi:hypothetical protein